MKKPRRPDPVFASVDNQYTRCTAEEKMKVFRAWRLFLENHFSAEKFTKTLYEYLILRCSFIAHYNRGGFYGVYFEPLRESTLRFIDQFDPAKPGHSVEYGDCLWCRGTMSEAVSPYYDLHKAMREEMGLHAERLRKMVNESMIHHAKAVLDSTARRLAELQGQGTIL